MRARIAILTLLALGGCATGLSERECEIGDWRRIGFQDGRDGQSSARLDDRVRECGRFDIPVDRVLYEDGRREGLTYFCSPRGALDASLRGVGNIGLCSQAEAITQRAFSRRRPLPERAV